MIDERPLPCADEGLLVWRDGGEVAPLVGEIPPATRSVLVSFAERLARARSAEARDLPDGVGDPDDGLVDRPRRVAARAKVGRRVPVSSAGCAGLAPSE